MWDGVGKMAVDAITYERLSDHSGVCGMDGDYLCGVNLITDIIYHYLDPRVRLGGDRA